MTIKLIRSLLCFATVIIASQAVSQVQTCPANINFSDGTLSNWFAYTGTFTSGSSRIVSVKQDYNSTSPFPGGTAGAVSIPEYGFSGMSGITVNKTASTDLFGGFFTIPNINGYQYDYSILIGSTAINSSPGGYFRGVGYVIDVPNGTGPYTMTYAYAMVLENGSHASIQQPLASATLMTNDSIIACASPQYFLPTNNGNLDVATATRNGFKLSDVPTPNSVQNNQSRYRVWTKNWTEVTFDLEPYRGQKVTLTFAAENCVPKGHFAYAYIALRNDCNGLMISGNRNACINSPTQYSIPALTDASYQWIVPAGWKIISDSSNIITVIPGTQGGFITAKEQNSCANLEATIQVTTSPPTVAGNLTGNNIVCEGNNNSLITLSGNTGNILKWISSLDGVSWTDIANTNNTYIAKNLNNSTQYKALVQNGPACSIDSASGATIVVNTKSKGGILSPNDLQICQDQNRDAILNLTGYNGNILNWQSSSINTINWTGFNPIKTNATYSITGVLAPSKFRIIVKNGVCEADTSTVSTVGIFNEKFPQASVSPIDTSICFGNSAGLNAVIQTGTNYTWSNPGAIFNAGTGIITSTPFAINAKVAPSKTTSYILSIKNGNCPNLLRDTFTVQVIPPITIFAGHDTSVVANQPLQLFAKTNNDSANLAFLWWPNTGLNNAFIINPIAILNTNIDSIKYIVKATSPEGCYSEDALVVRVFKTEPDLFIPTGFTPNNDGKNDILKPIPVGITKIDFFSIYNRWGQLVFTTSEFGKGWDGNFGGSAQPSGTYVFIAQGIDYAGRVIYKKGTSVLLR